MAIDEVNDQIQEDDTEPTFRDAPKTAVIRFDDENVLIIKHYLYEQVTYITLQNQKKNYESTDHITWWLA